MSIINIRLKVKYEFAVRGKQPRPGPAIQILRIYGMYNRIVLLESYNWMIKSDCFERFLYHYYYYVE